MDKADLAIAVALLSAVFTGSQAWSAHRTAKVAVAAAKRKEPAFEISSTPSTEFPGWTAVGIVARNFEPVAIKIERYSYKGRRIANADHFDHRRDYSAGPAQDVAEIASFWSTAAARTIGAAGDQASRSSAPHIAGPTVHLRVFVEGQFQANKLKIAWAWADGCKP